MIKNCKYCGKEFDAPTIRHYVCADCRKGRLKEYQDSIKERRKEKAKLNYAKKKRPKSSYSVEKTHREILEYEKKHGKRLTYGQYQVLKRLGKL